MSPVQVKVETRLNNVVYKCVLDDKFYNYKDRQPFSVSSIQAVLPVPQGKGQMIVSIGTVIICQNCYEENKGKGLNFEEPSKIVIPNSPLPNGIKDMVRGN